MKRDTYPFMMNNPFVQQPAPAAAPGYWFMLQAQKLVVPIGGNTVPFGTGPWQWQLELRDKRFLGTYNNAGCYSGVLPVEQQLPDNLELAGLRSLLGTLDEDMFTIAGRAIQLDHWRTTHLFCGRCGKPTTEEAGGELAVRCTECNLFFYPRISPVVIMSVVRDEHILLARSPRFRTGLFSALAGFVEPGETLEETVMREVQEEVNLQVKDIRYIASQPWPFPHSLMMGFQTTYAGGEIVIDQDEIEEAGWFTAHELPPIPVKGTIARHLIEHFLDNRGRADR